MWKTSATKMQPRGCVIVSPWVVRVCYLYHPGDKGHQSSVSPAGLLQLECRHPAGMFSRKLSTPTPRVHTCRQPLSVYIADWALADRLRVRTKEYTANNLAGRGQTGMPATFRMLQKVCMSADSLVCLAQNTHREQQQQQQQKRWRWQ